ncbi:glycosyltransferase family 61 protein [Salinibacter ruber]|uniref:glycosyltransferase family 61 protein n=1 Tax=Salinibacter ruber TaxID=146919 RepID=UPI00216942CA|nr:glycosyltransferase family 61 protein [Salinibacter ruber]MCS3683891.1 capsular polysaccharide biosynthesis protein [Salinibacter ruber]
MENAVIRGSEGLTTNRHGKYIFENSINRIKPLIKNIVVERLKNAFYERRNKRKISESVTSLLGPWVANYFHWLSDYLPRIRLLRKYERKTGSRPKILFPKNSQEWMKSSIRLLGVNPKRLYRWNNDLAKFDKLVVTSLPRKRNEEYNPEPNYSTESRKWVRNKILKNVNKTSHNVSRIYISREDASRRRLGNRDEVLKVLKKYGFEKYIMSNLSFVDQVSLFHSADLVVAPHGAGLTNILWSEKVSIIEIFGSEVFPCFFKMSSILGHKYSPAYGRTRGRDIYIDPDYINKKVKCLLACKQN